MFVPRVLRSKIAAAVALLVVAAVMGALPTFTTAQPVSAQGYQYCNGSYTNGSYCPQSGNWYCNGNFVNSSYCPTPGNQYCNGSYVTSNQYCCPNSTTYYGGYSPQPCSTNSSATYQSGWNIVSGPAGTTLSGNTGPLYTFPAGASNYTTLPSGSPLQSGVGYWAYFPSGGTANLGTVSSASTSIPLPPGQFIMIGNPGSSTATVSGANALVLIFSPSTNGYSETTQLAPGQGAWAASPTGGTLTITNSAPPPPPPPL